MSASSATITERHNQSQGLHSAGELVTLAQAAHILTEATGCRITYGDLYSRFLQRSRVQVPIKMHSVELGRKRRGRSVPTKCIRRADLPKLAAWMGFEIDASAVTPLPLGEGQGMREAAQGEREPGQVVRGDPE